jgi:hypothetical protein
MAELGVSELRERVERKCNIIVFGFPESEAEDAGARRTHDSAQFVSLCMSELGVEVDVSQDQVSRLGKKPENGNKPRPMRVRLETEGDRKQVLTNAKKLSKSENDSFHRVFIKKDMTPMEREEDVRLRALRDKKRKESQEKGEDTVWVIRRNKVVSLSNRRLAQPPKI